MRRFHFLLVWGILCLWLLPVTLFAGIKDRPYSIRIAGGACQAALNDSAQMWLVSPAYSAQFQYMLSSQTGLVIAAAYSRLYNDSTSASALKFNKARANRKWSSLTIAAGPKFYWHQRRGFAPFIHLTADLAIWKITHAANNEPVLVTSRTNGTVEYSAWELGGTAGIGFEKLFDNRVGFIVEADFTYYTGVNTDFAQSVVDSRSRGLVSILAGLSVNFGGAPRSLLREWEGRSKHEPPSYARRVYIAELDEATGDTSYVDQSRSFAGDGFASASSSPSDSRSDTDLDGVDDLLDKCPETPEGALVDDAGCPQDADADGVLDGIDSCPDTPKLARGRIDEFGCPLDSDGDAVPDYQDSCPDTPSGFAVDSHGCSLDSDHDGVADAVDRCQSTPTTVAVDKQGCPDYPSYFYTRILRNLPDGEDYARTAAASDLDSIAMLLRQFPEVTATISAFTDDAGKREANVKLTQRKADLVKKYLMSCGIESSRLRAVGEGEDHPLDSNRSAAGRERNRRVEIEFRFP